MVSFVDFLEDLPQIVDMFETNFYELDFCRKETNWDSINRYGS